MSELKSQRFPWNRVLAAVGITAILIAVGVTPALAIGIGLLWPILIILVGLAGLAATFLGALIVAVILDLTSFATRPYRRRKRERRAVALAARCMTARTTTRRGR